MTDIQRIAGWASTLTDLSAQVRLAGGAICGQGAAWGLAARVKVRGHDEVDLGDGDVVRVVRDVFQHGEWGGGCRVGEEDDEEEWQETQGLRRG